MRGSEKLNKVKVNTEVKIVVIESEMNCRHEAVSESAVHQTVSFFVHK